MSYLAVLALVSLALPTGERTQVRFARESSVKVTGAMSQGSWYELVYEAIEPARRPSVDPQAAWRT
jgi:hypothetical protein